MIPCEFCWAKGKRVKARALIPVFEGKRFTGWRTACEAHFGLRETSLPWYPVFPFEHDLYDLDLDFEKLARNKRFGR